MTALAALLIGFGLLALALGGHALEDALTGPEAEGRARAFHLGAQVHVAGALGLLWMVGQPGRAAPALALAGLLLFSGALYAYGLAGLKWPMWLTLPGAALIGAGWALAAWRARA